MKKTADRNDVIDKPVLKLLRGEVPSDISRRHFTSMLLLGAISAAFCKAEAQPTIKPFDTFDYDWIDTRRSRLVPSRLYWPANFQSTSRVPLIVFSHGIGGSRNGYSYLGKYLATSGIASLHVQHIGSDSALWKGNPFNVIGRLQAAAQEREAIARAADVSFALDCILSNECKPFGELVDSNRIVAAGHLRSKYYVTRYRR